MSQAIGRYAYIYYGNFVSKLSRDIAVPSLPMIAIALQTSDRNIQLSMVLNLLGISLSRLIWPVWSDMAGRRRMLLTSQLIFLASTMLCFMTPDFALFVVARLMQGFSVGAIPLLIRAWIYDMEGSRSSIKIYAWLAGLLAFSPAIATSLGGLLQQWFGWQASFVLMSIVAAMGLWYSFYLPSLNNNKQLSLAALKKGVVLLCMDKAFWLNVMPYSLLLSMMFVYFVMAPFIIPAQYNMSPSQLGLLSFWMSFGIFIGSVLSGRLIEHYSMRRIIRLGIIIAAIASTLLLFLGQNPNIQIYMMMLSIFGIGEGLLNATTKSASMDIMPELAGSALAISGFVQGMVNMLATFFAAMLPMTMLSLSFCIWLLAVLALIIDLLLGNKGIETG